MEDSLFSAFEKAAWMGNATDLPVWFVDLYRRAGVSHVLALSGQHVNILVWILLWGFRTVLFGVSFIWPLAGEWFIDRVADKLALLACGALLILSSFSPSVFRSFVMILSFWCLSRRSLFASPLQKVCSSLGISLLIWPAMADQIGFLLSGAMTTWLILLREGTPVRRAIRDFVTLSVSLSVLSLPLSVYFFGAGSWACPLWNLLFSPLWDAALIPLIYVGAVLRYLPYSGAIVGEVDYFLKFFVDFHASVEPWIDASYILFPRPSIYELLCVEVWLFCIVSRFRNDAPSIDFS